MLLRLFSFNFLPKYFCIFIFTLVFSFPLLAKNWLDNAHNSIYFNQITAEQGLPHPSVNSMVQDSRGFIWIATQDGLTRYDGKQFKTYTHQPGIKTSLSNNWVWDLHVDSEGRLWVASSGGFHLYLPEVDGFKNYNASKGVTGVEGSSYISITEAPNGNILFASQFSGYTEFDIKTATFKTYLNDESKLDGKSNHISGLVYDHNHNLWIASPHHGLSIQLQSQNLFHKVSYKNLPPPSEKLRILFVDDQNLIWVGSDDAGVFVVNQDFEITKHFQFDPNDKTSFCANYVNDILQAQNGEMWFATENGLCKLNQDGQTFTRIRHEPSRQSSLINNRTSNLMQDAGGVIWVGTQSGISRWNASLNYFTHISKNGSYKTLSSNSIMAFAMDSDQHLYLGTWNGGINVMSDDSATINHIRANPQQPNALQEDNIMSLLVDSKDNLWVGTLRSGLHLKQPGQNPFTVYRNEPNEPNSISDNAISKIVELSTGQYAIATYGGGLNIFNPVDNTFALIPLPSNVEASPNSIYIVDLTEDNQGNLWIATRDGGLLQYHLQTNQVTQYLADSKTPGQLISDDIFGVLNTKNYIWLATKDSGVARLSKLLLQQGKVVFDHINTQQGLASNFTYGLLQDNDDFIWVSHAKGLSRIDSSSFNVINFDTTHGLQGTDFNSSAIFQDNTGRMYFGGSNGFNTFMPNNVPVNNHKPALRLTQFSQSNVAQPIHQKLNEDGLLTLNYNQTIIDFEFAALDFTKPENNRYQYKMEGLNDNWIDLGTKNRVSFSYLTDGQYLLKVRGSNNDFIWSDEVHIPIEVLPPTWRAWYAYLSYFIMLSIIGFIILNQQKDKAKRQLAHEQRLHRLAYFDSLTGLPNRLCFYDKLEHFVSQDELSDKQATILFINLDRFKRINDNLGHEHGDAVLQVIAKRIDQSIQNQLSAELPKLDSPQVNLARLGSDEFTLLIKHAMTTQGISELSERIINQVSKPIKVGSYQVMVTASIGIASYPENGKSINELMKHADIAMHNSKEVGRRTYSFYANSLNDKGLEYLKLEEYLRTAIENQEFELHYQPQVDLVNNCVNKVEALVRWLHPQLGVVSPVEFIPLAEESGLIIELGEWILRESCFQAKKWLDQDMPCRISVNVSTVQFKQSALIEKVEQALQDSQLPPELLQLELTESAIMSDVEDNITRLQHLKDMGVTIAVDDFGTGYSSLSYLKKFPIDTLKIDRSFIVDLAENDHDRAIVKAIMGLADSMNIKVVAEGVENIEQLKILHQYKCEFIQGYYFSKPLKQQDLIQFVKHEYTEHKSLWLLDLIGK